MRITLVNGNYKPAWGSGGPARLLYELATFFRSAGWGVSVVTSNFSGEAKPLAQGYASEEGIDVYRLPAQSVPWLERSAAAIPTGLVSRLNLELGRSDAAIVCNTRSVFATVTPLICRRLGVPYAMAALGSLPGGRSRLNRLLRVGLDPLVVFPNCRKARYCVAQTRNEVEEYRRIGVEEARIRLIPLGSNTERFADLPLRGQFRRRFGIDEHAPMALFVGRLHFLKGIDTLISAAGIVRQSLPEFRFAIVGKDLGDEQRLREFTRASGLDSTVVFAGPLYEQEVVGAYTDADAYALAPRHFEETSLASIEASFCGTPLVFTREAEAPFFADEGGGYCVANSADDVAAGLLSILSSREEMQRMADAARKVAMTHYTMDVIGRSYESAFGLEGRKAGKL